MSQERRGSWKRVISVLIADDEDILREALRDLISDESGFAVVAVAADAMVAVAAAKQHQPDVALVDVRMPGGGAEAARGIRAVSPGTRVLALSAAESRETVFTMLSAGAAGYLVKGAPVSSILEAIRNVAAGQAPLSAEVAGPVVAELTDRLLEDQLASAQRAERLERLRGAMAGDALSFVYQPIFDLRSRAVVGYEALARFTMEPQRAPDVWFAEARDLGLERQLDVFAIRRAVLGLRQLGPDIFLCVNVAPDTIASGALNHPALVELGARLVFEVTEHAPVDDYDALHRGFAALRAAGARLAVDDAGAGYTSLRHILQLEPEIIKLDRVITAGLAHNRTSEALAQALISFAGHTGATVLAEGIESPVEERLAKEMGAVYGQGYLLGRPAPLDPAAGLPIAG
ncbi:MAG: EAL domain-containing protein [Candidatus Dormibacteria bacterium]